MTRFTRTRLVLESLHAVRNRLVGGDMLYALKWYMYRRGLRDIQPHNLVAQLLMNVASIHGPRYKLTLQDLENVTTSEIGTSQLSAISIQDWGKSRFFECRHAFMNSDSRETSGSGVPQGWANTNFERVVLANMNIWWHIAINWSLVCVRPTRVILMHTMTKLSLPDLQVTQPLIQNSGHSEVFVRSPLFRSTEMTCRFNGAT